MVKIIGIVDNLTSRKVGDKDVINVSMQQKIKGYATTILKFTVWSESLELFKTVKSLGEGQLIEVLATVGAEKRKGELTGGIVYYPISIVLV